MVLKNKLFVVLLVCINIGAPWSRYSLAINTGGGDGIRLTDIDNDGDEDAVVPGETNGVVRVYFNPGPTAVKNTWPNVRLPQLYGSPEDAHFVDLDRDGNMDVVIASEGGKVYAVWGSSDQIHTTGWLRTILLTRNKAMYAESADLDADGWPDLIIGGKQGDLLHCRSQTPRILTSWLCNKVASDHWVMNILAQDMDGDSDLDFIVADKGGTAAITEIPCKKHPGAVWYENTGNFNACWPVHIIVPQRGVMFTNVADIDNDGLLDVITATELPSPGIIISRRTHKNGLSWQQTTIAAPTRIKGITALNIVGNTDLELVVSSWDGIYYVDSITGMWTLLHDGGGKPDQLQLSDADNDGDLDIFGVFENLGLAVWYENPN